MHHGSEARIVISQDVACAGFGLGCAAEGRHGMCWVKCQTKAGQTAAAAAAVRVNGQLGVG
jgi:hypothetical protein